MKKEKVFVEQCMSYDQSEIDESLDRFDGLFAETIKPGQTVVLKPNWIAPGHKYNSTEWQSVITHPNFITGIIKKVIIHLDKSGKIVIADAPQTDTSFKKIAERMPFEEWQRLCNLRGIDIQILDLRDHEWVNEGDIIINRKNLPGDPAGIVEYNLKEELSEFYGHKPSSRGYYGADYNIRETTLAHSNGNHRYRVSKTIIGADVFINLPKWKTHKKAGITCSLKNLVGINTYKNFLPHHTEGTPLIGGDQFPNNSIKNLLEVYLLEYFKKILLKYEKYSRHLIPIKDLGKLAFGETAKKIRSGNWYGNNTLWRMILDLNKLLMYGNTDGTLRTGGINSQKKYLSFVDGIVAGEGSGPEAPDPFNTHVIIGGSNPVSVDCVAAKLMGFDYSKIPSLANAFKIEQLPLVNFSYDEIKVSSKTIAHYNNSLIDILKEQCFCFKAHFGWTGHIEMD